MLSSKSLEIEPFSPHLAFIVGDGSDNVVGRDRKGGKGNQKGQSQNAGRPESNSHWRLGDVGSGPIFRRKIVNWHWHMCRTYVGLIKKKTVVNIR